MHVSARIERSPAALFWQTFAYELILLKETEKFAQCFLKLLPTSGRGSEIPLNVFFNLKAF